MTYKEYCRMKCFSKKTAEEKAGDLHNKRMNTLKKGCRSDKIPNEPWADEKASNSGDSEYKQSIKNCKDLKVDPKNCNAVINAKEAFNIVRTKPGCDEK